MDNLLGVIIYGLSWLDIVLAMTGLIYAFLYIKDPLFLIGTPCYWKYIYYGCIVYFLGYSSLSIEWIINDRNRHLTSTISFMWAGFEMFTVTLIFRVLILAHKHVMIRCKECFVREKFDADIRTKRTLVGQ